MLFNNLHSQLNANNVYVVHRFNFLDSVISLDCFVICNNEQELHRLARWVIQRYSEMFSLVFIRDMNVAIIAEFLPCHLPAHQQDTKENILLRKKWRWDIKSYWRTYTQIGDITVPHEKNTLWQSLCWTSFFFYH